MFISLESGAQRPSAIAPGWSLVPRAPSAICAGGCWRRCYPTAVGTLVALGLWALGVPLAGTLGIIAAQMTFIPNVGPIVSVVPAALLAVAISPGKGLLTVLLFMLVHFLEGNIITPLLQRKIVRLPPALTLKAQLLLAVIAGPLGLALAAPLTAAALGVFQVLLPADGVASAFPMPAK